MVFHITSYRCGKDICFKMLVSKSLRIVCYFHISFQFYGEPLCVRIPNIHFVYIFVTSLYFPLAWLMLFQYAKYIMLLKKNSLGLCIVNVQNVMDIYINVNSDSFR